MTLSASSVAVVEAIGVDIKGIITSIGNLASLPTAAKTSIVAALAELHAAIQSASSIDDSAVDGDTTSTYSADKILDLLVAAKNEIKDDLLGGVGSAFDTLKELADAIGNDGSLAANLGAAIANRVRYDQAMTLTEPQKLVARTNIGAVSMDEVDTHLVTTYGDPDADLLAAYNAAKA